MKDFIKNNKTDLILYLFLAILLSVFVITYNTIDMDYWARLIQGNFFWHTGHILKEDIFSYTPTHKWLDHEWGSSIIFSFIQAHFGFNGIIFFRALILFFIFFLIHKTIKINFPKNNILLNFIYFTAIIYAVPTLTQSGLRCHFFTFLFFTLFLYILEKVRKTGKYKLLSILPLLMLFWANIHGGCVAGLGLIGMYSIGEILNKKPFKYYILTLFICLLMLFINPYGIDYVKFLFMASTMERPFVTEWISPFAHPYWQFMLEFKILYILNILLILLNIKNIKNDYTKYILLIICAFVSARYVKNTPFFIITSAVFLYETLYDLINNFLENHKRKIYLLFCAFILLFPIKELFLSLPSFPISQQPIQAVEFFRINDLKCNILAPFDYGSYITYKLYPNNLIYMDGRYEEVYYNEQKILTDNFYNVKNNWQEILEPDTTDYIIIPSNALLTDYMPQIKGYSLIYNDKTNCIYAKNNLIKQNYKIPSDDWKYYLNHAFDSNIEYE